MKKEVRLISACKNFCGEAPIWDTKRSSLFWVDTGRRECFSLSPCEGNLKKIEVDGLPQALAFRQERGWICPMEDRVVLLDDQFNIEKDLGTPLKDDSPFLLGDGTVGPDGCYYFGTYHPEDLSNKGGAVYRVNKDYSFEKVVPNMALPNGMAFSKNGEKFYLTEMFGNCIWEFDFSARTGKFSNKTLFTEVPEHDGYPDGLILDGEGGIWSAHWQGFKVTRYTSDGKIDKTVPIPVPTATCMAFNDSGTLYITTASKGNSREQMEEYIHSGSLYAIETSHTAIPERAFIG